MRGRKRQRKKNAKKAAYEAEQERRLHTFIEVFDRATIDHIRRRYPTPGDLIINPYLGASAKFWFGPAEE